MNCRNVLRLPFLLSEKQCIRGNDGVVMEKIFDNKSVRKSGFRQKSVGRRRLGLVERRDVDEVIFAGSKEKRFLAPSVYRFFQLGGSFTRNRSGVGGIDDGVRKRITGGRPIIKCRLT